MPADLPALGSMATRVVQLKYTKPADLVNILTPFASGWRRTAVLPIDASGILVLRDNVANVKRMLEMIEKVDVTMPSEFHLGSDPDQICQGRGNRQRVEQRRRRNGRHRRQPPHGGTRRRAWRGGR